MVFNVEGVRPERIHRMSRLRKEMRGMRALWVGFLLLSGVAGIGAVEALPEFLSIDRTPEEVAGNPARVTVRPDDTSAAVEEWFFDTDGRLVRKEIQQPGSFALTTRYRYADDGQLVEWFQHGIDERRLWGYRLEYDAPGRLIRVITEGPGGQIEYIEEYSYRNGLLHESVLYNAAGMPMWRRKIEQTSDAVAWRLLQPNGILFSQGHREYDNGRLRREEVRDSGGAVIERIEYRYDGQGRLLLREMYDAVRLVERTTNSYISDTLHFSRIIAPQEQGQRITHVLTRLDDRGNWTRQVVTDLFEEAGEVTVVDSRLQTRTIEYQE